MEKEILIVIDMQNDFLTGALANADGARVLAYVKEKVAAARLKGKTVVFTRDTHEEDYLSTQEGKNLPVVHCVKGTDGWQIADGLYKAGEKVFDKPTFGSLELASFIKDGGYTKAEFVGVCTDICVVSNVMLVKAYCPETEIIVDEKGCAGVTKERHDAALETMRSCQANVI